MDNRSEYQRLRAPEYPDFLANTIYFLYGRLLDFIEYYKFKNRCERALGELNSALQSDFPALRSWTRKFEELGSQNLLMFEINYFDWTEEVPANSIKIDEGVYTESEPFLNILCFCMVFNYLFWVESIDKVKVTEKEKTLIKIKLNNILDNFSFNKEGTN